MEPVAAAPPATDSSRPTVAGGERPLTGSRNSFHRFVHYAVHIIERVCPTAAPSPLTDRYISIGSPGPRDLDMLTAMSHFTNS
jgi:hypothetical protein